MMDYRNSTLGPYGEVGIGIQAVRKGTGATLIGYLWDLVANVFHVDEMLSLYEQDDSGMRPCGHTTLHVIEQLWGRRHRRSDLISAQACTS